jgi:hypothetical protein
MIKFFTSNDRETTNMTSNITHLLGKDWQWVLHNTVTPELMVKVFGTGCGNPFIQGDYEYDCKGYTDDEWYFKGPCDVVLGIGFRWNQPRLRGKNLDNQFLTEQEICSKFMEFLIYSRDVAEVEKCTK